MFPIFMIVLGTMCLALSTSLAETLAGQRFSLPDASRRAGCLDGLRGYLALGVMFHHFTIWVGMNAFGRDWVVPQNPLLASLGPGSVLLFFATTGYIFYPRVLAGLSNNDWTSLYIGRVMRILPLSALSIGIVLAIITLTGEAVAPLSIGDFMNWLSGRCQVALLGYEHAGRVDALVLWSLWHEWIFYVAILPLMALMAETVGGRLPRWLLPLAMLALALVVRRLHLFGSLSELWPMFAIGMLCNEACRRDAIRKLVASAKFTPIALSALALAVSGSKTFGVPEMLLYGIFFLAIAGGNSVYGLLNRRGALVLGECSFSIYLLHGIVLWLFFTATWNWPASLLLPKLILLGLGSSVVVTLVCFASHLLVEKPAIGVGARMRDWTRGTSPAFTLRPVSSTA